MAKSDKNANVNKSYRPSDEETTQINAFLPYWPAEEGKSFYAMPVGRDARDPKFVRVIWRACEPLQCFSGSVDDQKEVGVDVGEFFTTSEYGSMRVSITDAWMGYPVVVSIGDEKGENDKGDFYQFTYKHKINDAKAIKAGITSPLLAKGAKPEVLARA